MLGCDEDQQGEAEPAVERCIAFARRDAIVCAYAGQSITEHQERNQSDAMMPSSAVQTTRPATIVAVGPPRNVSPPNGEFLLFESV